MGGWKGGAGVSPAPPSGGPILKFYIKSRSSHSTAVLEDSVMRRCWMIASCCGAGRLPHAALYGPTWPYMSICMASVWPCMALCGHIVMRRCWKIASCGGAGR